jgi:DNA-binding transcriptional ArsR family regulator
MVTAHPVDVGEIMEDVSAREPQRRLTDPERVDAALAGLGDRETVREWADRFSVIADPSRLALLVCIHYAGEICVSDLAVAVDMSDTAVSQALRLLRAHSLVTAHRRGRAVYYRLADDTMHELIHHVRPHTVEEQ